MGLEDLEAHRLARLQAEMRRLAETMPVVWTNFTARYDTVYGVAAVKRQASEPLVTPATASYLSDWFAR